MGDLRQVPGSRGHPAVPSALHVPRALRHQQQQPQSIPGFGPGGTFIKPKLCGLEALRPESRDCERWVGPTLPLILGSRCSLGLEMAGSSQWDLQPAHGAAQGQVGERAKPRRPSVSLGACPCSRPCACGPGLGCRGGEGGAPQAEAQLGQPGAEGWRQTRPQRGLLKARSAWVQVRGMEADGWQGCGRGLSGPEEWTTGGWPVPASLLSLGPWESAHEHSAQGQAPHAQSPRPHAPWKAPITGSEGLGVQPGGQGLESGLRRASQRCWAGVWGPRTRMAGEGALPGWAVGVAPGGGHSWPGLAALGTVWAPVLGVKAGSLHPGHRCSRPPS